MRDRWPDWSPCSRNAHDKKVLVRVGRVKILRAVKGSLGRSSLIRGRDNCKIIVGIVEDQFRLALWREEADGASFPGTAEGWAGE